MTGAPASTIQIEGVGSRARVASSGHRLVSADGSANHRCDSRSWRTMSTLAHPPWVALVVDPAAGYGDAGEVACHLPPSVGRVVE